jgi:hypothetical protein
MKPEVVYFSFPERVPEKSAARAIDEAKLKSGEGHPFHHPHQGRGRRGQLLCLH